MDSFIFGYVFAVALTGYLYWVCGYRKVSPAKEDVALRDRFAAAAMLGMNANPELLQVVTSGSILDGSAFDRMAKKAYEVADSMLAARDTKVDAALALRESGK